MQEIWLSDKKCKMENFFFLIVGLIVLVIGAESLVKGASNIAIGLKISPLVVGLTIVAFGTSAPELFVSIKSALEGHPDLAFGNIIGSNMCNIALVLGVTAMIFPVGVNKDIINFNWPVAFLSVVLLYVLTLDHNVDRIDGVIFVIMLIVYNFLTIKMSRKALKKEQEESGETYNPEFNDIVKSALFIIVGCVALVFGAEWLVNSAKNIASDFGVSDRLIAVTIVAIGTSLPELATSIVAAIRKNSEMGLGNLIGSNIFNVLSILGITGMIQPIHVDEMFSNYDLFWVIGVTALLYPLMKSRGRINRLEGVLLLLIYVAYIVSITILKS